MKKLPFVKKMNVEKYPSSEEDKCLLKSGRSAGSTMNNHEASRWSTTHLIALWIDKRSSHKVNKAVVSKFVSTQKSRNRKHRWTSAGARLSNIRWIPGSPRRSRRNRNRLASRRSLLHLNKTKNNTKYHWISPRRRDAEDSKSTVGGRHEPNHFFSPQQLSGETPFNTQQSTVDRTNYVHFRAKIRLGLCISDDGRKFDEDDSMIEALKCNLDLEYFVKLTSLRYLTTNLRLKVRTIRIYLLPSFHPEDYIISSSEDFRISQVERQCSRLESRQLRWWSRCHMNGFVPILN